MKCLHIGPLEIWYNVFWRRGAKSRQLGDALRAHSKALAAQRAQAAPYQQHPVQQGLQYARALLADEAHWTRDVSARTVNGMPVLATDKDAVSFCMLGAIIRAHTVLGLGELGRWGMEMAIQRCVRKAGYYAGGIGGYNDNPNTTHADILNVLDCAIEEEAP